MHSFCKYRSSHTFTYFHINRDKTYYQNNPYYIICVCVCVCVPKECSRCTLIIIISTQWWMSAASSTSSTQSHLDGVYVNIIIIIFVVCSTPTRVSMKWYRVSDRVCISAEKDRRFINEKCKCLSTEKKIINSSLLLL